MENYDGINTGYLNGNIERWSYLVTSYLPQAWKTLVKTIDPLIYAALVELMGSNTRFDKQSGDVKPILDTEGNISGLNVTLLYTVPDFAGYAGDQAAVMQDSQYILRKCQAVPSVQWTDKSVTIDTGSGHVRVNFVLPIGYAG